MSVFYENIVHETLVGRKLALYKKFNVFVRRELCIYLTAGYVKIPVEKVVNIVQYTKRSTIVICEYMGLTFT